MKQKNTRQTGLFDSARSEKVWSVSELTTKVRLILEKEISPIRVAGEISAMTRASSGHLYFQLKDKDSAIDAVMFRSSAARMPGAVPPDGTQVECMGRMTMYEPRGKAQLVVDRMRPMGEGALALRFEELKRKLAQEGLFDQGRKKALPPFPARIGVVTSPDGAAIRDILKVMGRRFPGVEVLIAPALVQGSSAAGQIANGIHLLESMGKVDLIIVGRGGGSLEDLWAFNEEEVVRAIAECELPTVSAVGHETDVVLSDLAADLRAPTPSAAAELVVPNRDELMQVLDSLINRLSRSIDWRIGQARAAIQEMTFKLRDPSLLLVRHRISIDDMTRSMTEAVSKLIASKRSALSEQRVKLAAFEPRQRLGRERQRMSGLQHRLLSSMRHLLEDKRKAVESGRDSLARLSPLAVLSRGYSLVYDPQGRLLRNASKACKGDLLRIQPSEGIALARVERTEEDDSS